MPETVVCSLLVSRRVRTHMPWWCGDWGLETPGYPIRPKIPPQTTMRRNRCRVPPYTGYAGWLESYVLMFSIGHTGRLCPDPAPLDLKSQ